MVSTETGSPDSVRKKLEEIFKLMLMVWAKEGIALSALTGQQNGNAWLNDDTVLFYWKQIKSICLCWLKFDVLNSTFEIIAM